MRVYFSGTHGSGKSTLITKLVESYPDSFHTFERMDCPKQDDSLTRGKIRIARYYIESFMEQELERKNPDKILLADRFVYDSLIYSAACVDLGWMGKKEYDGFLGAYNCFFGEADYPQNVVFVNPSLERTIAQIKNRWEKKGEKKWREEDFSYLSAVKATYESWFRNREMLGLLGMNLRGDKGSLRVLELNDEPLEEKVLRVAEWCRQGLKMNGLGSMGDVEKQYALAR